jgi:hypothetical protein
MNSTLGSRGLRMSGNRAPSFAVNYVPSEAAKAQGHAHRLMALLGDALAGVRSFELVIHDFALGNTGKALIARFYMNRRFHRLSATELILVETVAIITLKH